MVDDHKQERVRGGGVEHARGSLQACCSGRLRTPLTRPESLAPGSCPSKHVIMQPVAPASNSGVARRSSLRFKYVKELAKDCAVHKSHSRLPDVARQGNRALKVSSPRPCSCHEVIVARNAVQCNPDCSGVGDIEPAQEKGDREVIDLTPQLEQDTKPPYPQRSPSVRCIGHAFDHAPIG